MSDNLVLGPLIGVGATAEIYTLGSDRAVKLFFPFVRDKYVGAEARASEAVYQAGLSVPKYFGQVEIDGRRGLVFERLDGITMREALLRRPWKAHKLLRQAADLQRELHQCQISHLPTFREYLVGQIEGAPRLTEMDKERLLAYLDQLPTGGQVLCHGDFHLGNVMLTSRGPVIIDWTVAMSGSPEMDLARTHFLISTGALLVDRPFLRSLSLAVVRHFCRIYDSRYFRDNELSPSQVDAWTPIIAAARLSEKNEHEFEHLLHIARHI